MSNQVVFVLVVGTLIMLSVGVYLVLFIIRYRQSQHIYLLEKSALQNTFNNQLLQSRLETQEQSFQYFSEEIHDNVGQVLSVVGMQLYQLRAECKGEREQRLAQQSSDLLNKAINDLRSISHTLNAQFVSKAGLIEALDQEIAYINSVKGAHCRLDVQGEPEELSSDRQTLLYRILQEAVGNALKHSKATDITIRLSYAPSTLTAIVKDNGQGFDIKSLDGARTGLGLTNMQLRAGLLGGTLLVQSEPDKGTTLSLSINIHPDRNPCDEPNA